MPIRKFRDVSEMEDTLWYERGDPALFAALARVWDFAQRTCQPRFPPGVYKHRSLADMDAQCERWEAANFEAFQERRRKAAELARAERPVEEPRPRRESGHKVSR